MGLQIMGLQIMGLEIMGLEVMGLEVGSRRLPAGRRGRSAIVAVAYLIQFLHFFLAERLLVAEQVRD
jgi:hypothetical protein